MAKLGVRSMDFKEVLRWKADEMPETEFAVVVVSDCGNIIKRLPYKKWNIKNKSYSVMKEKIYTQSSNRGKQRHEDSNKKETHGEYKHVEIGGRVYSVHRLVASAFIENRDKLPCVNHIDGNRSNNHVSNLEWVTNKDNVRHSWEVGLRNIQRMRKLDYSHMKDILKLREQGLSFSKIGAIYDMAGESIRHRVKQYENGLRC